MGQIGPALQRITEAFTSTFSSIISNGSLFFFFFLLCLKCTYFNGLCIFPAAAHRHLFSANNYNYVTHVREAEAQT